MTQHRASHETLPQHRASDPISTILDLAGLLVRYPFKPWTIRNYCAQGKIPHIKIGRRIYFDTHAIDAWLQAHERPVGYADQHTETVELTLDTDAHVLSNS